MAINKDNATLTDRWPLHDLIGALRNVYADAVPWGGTKGDEAGPPPPGPPRNPYEGSNPVVPDEAKLPPELRELQSSRIYPYTKGVEFGNDGISYGEETIVSVRSRCGETTYKQTRRQTRTGSVVLSTDPPIAGRVPPAEAAAEEPSLSKSTSATASPPQPRSASVKKSKA